jgi:hypothetical protein
MFNPLLAAGLNVWNVDLWYAVPAIIAVSLVYAATRHEQMRPILFHAGRVAIWITGFMVAIFAVIQFVSWLVT